MHKVLSKCCSKQTCINYTSFVMLLVLQVLNKELLPTGSLHTCFRSTDWMRCWRSPSWLHSEASSHTGPGRTAWTPHSPGWCLQLWSLPETQVCSKNRHSEFIFFSQELVVHYTPCGVLESLFWPVFHVPEDCCAAKTCCHAEMGVRFGKRGQEVVAAASILPGDQLTGVSGSEEVPAGPVTTYKGKRGRNTVYS